MLTAGNATGAPGEAPRAFGDYHLLHRFAEGGMGSIHLARRAGFRPNIQRFCVVKLLRHDLARQPSFVRRFHDEARSVVTLNHRALCHGLDVDRVDDELYLAMELIDGVSLRALWTAARERGRAIPADIALAIIDEVLDALSYAHTHTDPQTGAPLHIVHRDVSPQNVLVSCAGAVKLIDFGLVSSTLKSEQTAGGLVVGKLAYMAPEQARGEPTDARTDVYATAVVLWEVLTGRRFFGELGKGVIAMHLTKGTWQPSLDDDPAVLREPLRAALAPEPGDRTTSAAVFASALAASGIPRALSRALREFLAEVMPGARDTHVALVRRCASITVAPAAERTTITHLARSSDNDVGTTSDDAPVAVADSTHGLANEPTHILPAPTSTTAAAARAGSLRVFAVAVSLLTTTIVLGGWWAVRKLALDDTPPSHETGGGMVDAGSVSPAIDVGERIVTDAGGPLETDTDAGVAGRAVTDAGDERGDGGDGEDDGTPAPVRRPKRVTRPRPPDGPLPDLRAQLEYLKRWCVGRVSCAERMVASRPRVPL